MLLENRFTLQRLSITRDLQHKKSLDKTKVLVASNADVLRLVTRSSPRGEERVTSLRTSAWEVKVLVDVNHLGLFDWISRIFD